MLVIVGGNSSVMAINWQGVEQFWNVVSGKVCSMITFDFDKDGENEVSNEVLCLDNQKGKKIMN